MSMLIFKATCFTDNRLLVHSSLRGRYSYQCDPALWMAPGVELVMMSKLSNVSIEIKELGTPFSLHARFKMVLDIKSRNQEVRKVTKYLGKYTYKHTCTRVCVCVCVCV